MCTRGSKKLVLAMFTEKFVAFSAFQWREWKVAAHDAFNFFDHFSLEFVGYKGHFDVEGGDGLGSHYFFDGLVGY